jgi:ankyrin repeat protein
MRNQSPAKRNIAVRTLLWAMHAKRPLHISEMVEAIAIKPAMVRLDSGEKIKDARLVVACCADLVFLDKEGYVQLVHSSARDVLTSATTLTNGSFGELRILSEDPGGLIAEACLVYLMFDIFETGAASDKNYFANRLAKHKFYSYAAQNWALHCRQNKSHHLRPLLLTFLSNASKREACLQANYANKDPNRYSEYPLNRNALHIIAEYGLVHAMSFLPDARMMSTERDSWSLSPLDLSLIHAHRDVCAEILSFGDWLNKKDSQGHPLHTAIKHGWGDLVDRMLHLRANLELKDRDGYTPLQVASQHCRDPTILKKLLEAGADLEACTAEVSTSLLLAAEAGHSSNVNSLIEAGASLRAVNTLKQTAVHVAAGGGHLQIVRMLVEAGHQPDIIDAVHETPLYDAVLKGHKMVTEYLLQVGCSGSAVNIAGATPLHVATACGHDEVAMILLRDGADPLAYDRMGWCVLHILAFMKNLTVLNALRPSLAQEYNLDPNSDIADIIFAAIQSHKRPKHGLLWSEAHFYVLLERSDRLREWLAQGSDVNATDNYGMSLLHLASAANSESTLRTLLESGETTTVWDQWHRSPYDLAIGEVGERSRRLLEERQDATLTIATRPGQLQMKNSLYLQNFERNFCLLVYCDECTLLMDGICLRKRPSP